MKWATLIEKVRTAHGDVIDGVEVRSIDVRNVGALRARFPELFPKYLRTGLLHADTDAKGEWVITKRSGL